jgi:Mg-chelatase subunit ChlD
MRSRLLVLSALLFIFTISSLGVRSQEQSQKKKGEEAGESIKIDTNLITVPVVVSDRNDVYLPDLKRDDFTIYEDGVKQQLDEFIVGNVPFQVVLLLDTSGSTHEKLGQIQRAASAFVAQLQPADRIKIISFDDSVKELSTFTNDRAVLERAIRGTAPGEGTKLYDAMKMALNNLATLKGRKAIVIFTDGVDWRSDRTTSDDNLAAIEEAGVIVYPIRYETRAETEAMVREQSDRYGSAVDVGLILGGPPIGTTPPTVPGGGPFPIPQRKAGSKDDPYRLPGPDPSVILNDPRMGRNPGRNPNGGGYPDDRTGRYPDDRTGNRYPDDRTGRYPDDRYPSGGRTDDRFPDTTSPTNRGRARDSVGLMLDNLYQIGDRYLLDLARVSGGKLQRADTLRDLPKAFGLIAAELRQQYLLGYYPTNDKADGKYRKIHVKVNRDDAVVRARPGYRAAKAK